MTVLAYIVRPGSSNPELRYSLRSVWYNMPHTGVIIVGYCPPWIRDVHTIPVEQSSRSGDKRMNALRNLVALAAGGPDEFVLMNDDFFAMHPTADPPARVHRGRLASLADDREAARPGSEHAQVLRNTDALLRDAGIGEPLAYETHTPMLMRAEHLALALDYGDRLGSHLFAPRSIVGNLVGPRGEQIGNVKVYGGEVPPPIGRHGWISTTDTSFRYHPIGDRIRRLFPEPSPYEAP